MVIMIILTDKKSRRACCSRPGPIWVRDVDEAGVTASDVEVWFGSLLSVLPRGQVVSHRVVPAAYPTLGILANHVTLYEAVSLLL